MSDRREDKDQDLDPAGERGGDTGPGVQKGKGAQAEKGDQRRNTPVHSGPTRNEKNVSSGRSGSDSNAGG